MTDGKINRQCVTNGLLHYEDSAKLGVFRIVLWEPDPIISYGTMYSSHGSTSLG